MPPKTPQQKVEAILARNGIMDYRSIIEAQDGSYKAVIQDPGGKHHIDCGGTRDDFATPLLDYYSGNATPEATTVGQILATGAELDIYIKFSKGGGAGPGTAGPGALPTLSKMETDGRAKRKFDDRLDQFGLRRPTNSPEPARGFVSLRHLSTLRQTVKRFPAAPASLRAIIRDLATRARVDNVLIVGLSESYDPRSNIAQLKEVVCGDWKEEDLSRLSGAAKKGFVVVGIKADPNLRWRNPTTGEERRSVATIRAIFTVAPGAMGSVWGSTDRKQFKSRATVDVGLWRDYVGEIIDYNTNQLQGPHWNGVSTEPQNGGRSPIWK